MTTPSKHHRAIRAALLGATLCLSGFSFAAQNEPAKKGSDQIKVLSKGVEVVEVKPTADKCPKPNDATSLRLKVTSETPVDVLAYVQWNFKKWVAREFKNQKLGDEISDYYCRSKVNYKVYTRPAGSSEAWPKP
jgi:hypothetical protein